VGTQEGKGQGRRRAAAENQVPQEPEVGAGPRCAIPIRRDVEQASRRSPSRSGSIRSWTPARLSSIFPRDGAASLRKPWSA